jgi:hypothetical protein
MRLFCLILLGLLFGIHTRLVSGAVSETPIVLGEILHGQGRITFPGSSKASSEIQKQIFQNSLVELGEQAFAHFNFSPEIYIKSRKSTVFRVRKIESLKILSFELFKGSLFVNLPKSSSSGWTVEVNTPQGILLLREGDSLLRFRPRDQSLHIYCSEGLALFQYHGLEYSLGAGEKLAVKGEKVAFKAEIQGSENRYLFSWYRQGDEWPLSNYLASFRGLDQKQRAVLRDFRLNGLSDEDWESYQTFSAADLVLGRLRLEGRIENKLEHQILQVSLNNGRDYFDLPTGDHFVLKLIPKEQIYEVFFRLRDLDRTYDLVQDELIFFYQKRGNRELILQWIDSLRQSYFRKNARELSNLLRGSTSFSATVVEDLQQDFALKTSQKLDLTLARYRESRKKIIADFRWFVVYTQMDTDEPVRRSGRWQVVFSRHPVEGFQAEHFSGDFPFLPTLAQNRLDRYGPRISGTSLVRKDAFVPTVIRFQAEDDLSAIDRLEYFVDQVGRNGAGISIMPDDGKLDELLERGSITLTPGIKALRIFVHGRDIQGNWGRFLSVTLGI